MTEFDILQIEQFIAAGASGKFSEWPNLRKAVTRMKKEHSVMKMTLDAMADNRSTGAGYIAGIVVDVIQSVDD